ncbi:MAG: ATP-dependent RecD-like DNA helicase [Planctomycetota bacterium]
MSQSGKTITGTVDRIVFTNEENLYTVARLRRGEGDPDVTVVGPLAGVREGETLRLTGEWIEHERFGTQFKIESFQTITPETKDGLIRYLGSGLVAGIGPKLAERLVNHLGLQTLDVLDRQPWRLGEVPGIGRKRIEDLRRAWVEQRAVRDILIFLRSYGIGAAQAARIHRRYGKNAIARIKSNPYCLAEDIAGIGFQTADRMAQALGLAADAPERLRAGLQHVLGEAFREGNLFLPEAELSGRATRILHVEAPLLEGPLAQLLEDGTLHRFTFDGHAAVASRSAFVIESNTHAFLQRMLALGRPPVPELSAAVVVEELAREEELLGLRCSPGQRRAFQLALQSRMTVITGGPGTGKTTLTRLIVRTLERHRARVLLAAPTGRAARRLAEATGKEASTLHRLLKYRPEIGDFDHDQDNPLHADAVLVDEVSMVDAALFERLLRALPERTRLILVGDVDQIPSVGAGAVLRELILSGKVPTARLLDIYRQGARSEIITAAHRINSGELPELRAPGPDSDFFFIERPNPESAVQTVLEVVTRRIPTRFGLDAIDDVQVLVPMYRGVGGAENLNVSLQAELVPEASRELAGPFRVGDKVMQLKNDYDREVFNGDIGRVVALDAEEGRCHVQFESGLASYGATDLDALTLAYAITIHKAQGGEFPAVVIVMLDQHHLLLRRNLLYTAVTRGRRLVVIIGSRRALAQAVSHTEVDRRYTRLGHLLNADPELPLMEEAAP